MSSWHARLHGLLYKQEGLMACVSCVQRSGAKRGHQLWLAWHGLVFHTHLALHTSLHRLSPRLFKRPAFTRAVLGEVPYRC